MIEQQVIELIPQHNSFQDVAAALGINRTTVRYYAKKHGLTSHSRRSNRQLEDGQFRCATCGTTEAESFYANNKYRCKACEVQRLRIWRNTRKQREIQKRGGCCSMCGYSKYIGALEFHHTDPLSKEFDWSTAVMRSQQAIDAELEKCVIVCANCHREIHAANFTAKGQIR